LTGIYPRGVKCGGEYKLRFTGARLKDAEEILFYDSGVSVLEIKAVNANALDVRVKVDEDCRIGEHVAQVRTKNGISDYRSFFIGRLSEVAEAEPNSALDQSQKIEMNVTVTGIVTNEDIDYFRIEGKKGDRVSCEIEALRMGFLFDPAIALLDKNRFELAVSDDTPLTKQDGYFSVLLPEDGEYFITVRESSFRGNGQSHYRLHVGNFPRPAAVYPAGGKPGEKVSLQFIDAFKEGQDVRSVSQEVQLPKEEGFRFGVFASDENGFSPTPMPFRLNDLPNFLEQEPNNSFPEMAALSLPQAINGIVSEPGDIDYHKFTAKKGQVWHIECFARRIGSGLDAVVNVFDAKTKKHLGGNDDLRKSDSYFRFQVPADGEYYVRVYDHLKRGQPDFVYRLEMMPAKPELTVGIKRVDRYSQQRQSIAIPQGSRFAVLVEAKRKDFGGTIELLNDNLPPGVKMTAPPMASNLNLMPVVFEVEENAALGGQLVDFRARHKLKDKNFVEGGFRNFADFVLGQPNNSLYYGCTVDKLAFAVVEKLPFKLELVQPKVPMVRNGQMKIKIVAHRDEKFDAPINLQFPFRTPGVGTTYQITIPKGKSEAYYPLNANSGAQIGKWPMVVIGNSNFKGAAWTSTKMGELEIAEPFVTAEMPRVTMEIGKTAQLVCKLNQLKPFEGEAVANIVGIPPNIIIDTPKKFTKDTKELIFTIQTNEKSPIGKHGGMFCQVTITQNGEPIQSRAGNAVVRINKPKPPKKPKVAAKKAVAPAAKPTVPTNKPAAPTTKPTP
ncbi:MAG: PPC domain-containing protein, partial [Mariniblastus sp.]